MISTRRSGFLAVVAAMCLAVSGVVASSPASSVPPPAPAATTAAAGPADAGWFTSWAQSQQRVAGKIFTNQSMRMITHLSQGGDAVRIRLQNQFGTAPVTIEQTSLALSAGGAAIVASSNRALTFNGSESVTIPVGGEVWSDPTSIETTAQQDVAVTFFLPVRTVASLHDLAGRNNYGAAANSGNRNSEASGSSFTEALPWTYFVSAVDVYNTSLAGTIVAYGSSVVDGTGSDNCGAGCSAFGQNKRWTDDLARRVVAELPKTQQFTVVNEGIGGTVSSPACSGGGLDGVSRLDRDVLALRGVTGVIVYYGTNDIALGCSSTDILASYRTIFGRLREAGIKVFVTPITPRPGYSTTMNGHRQAVNAFVRAGGNCDGTCDGVVDFDAVLKDPANPNSINPLYDAGDGVHANVAGQQAIADSIPLAMLATRAAPTIESGPLTTATVGSAYSSAVVASAVPRPSFAVTDGALPSGLSLDRESGKITGIPVAAGAHTFTITVSNGIGRAATAVYTLTVGQAASSTILSVPGPPVHYGQTRNVDVTVRAAGTTPTGTVELRSGSTLLATGSLPASAAGEAASVTIAVTQGALAPGSHPLTASYAGDSSVSASSATTMLRIAKARASVAVKLPRKILRNQRARIAVVVKAPGVARLSGKVVVYDGKRRIGTAMVDKRGKATVTSSRLKAGRHRITVTYQGSTYVAKATGKATTVRIR